VQGPGHEALLTIQRGAPDRAPLACMPGAGDNVAAFSALAAALDPDQPILGLLPRGLAQGQVPHTSVQAAARAHLAALLRQVSSGPIHPLGHSFGGWIAFEMALQLRALGRTPASVTLVDTDPPAGPKAPEYSHLDALLHLIELFELRGPSLALRREDLGMTPWSGPGDHLSILQPPHVAQLAHRIGTLALGGRSHPPGEHQAGGSRRQAVPHDK
jgi:thioesterase domain-containing protein